MHPLSMQFKRYNGGKQAHSAAEFQHRFTCVKKSCI